MPEAIEANDVHVTFETVDGDHVHAVRGVSLTVAPGETVGIVGESGSGKSTLARAIVGLLPLAAGTILVHGDPVEPVGRRRRVRRLVDLQMVHQDPYSSLNPRQRPLAAVAEAVKHCQGVSARDAAGIASEILRSVGISDAQASMLPKALSGGQRQRVSIARALAANPTVLIADEPTSALDQSIAASILNLLRRIQEERNLALLFISHDLGVIRYLTHRVYVMADGCVVEEGPTADVFNSPQQPYTQQLIAAIPGRQDTDPETHQMDVP